jgi:V/A-type H+-transporting ATPase subunit B
MKDGIGEGKTREDHAKVADQMYALYAEGRDLRGLVAIVGEEALSERDVRKLRFAEAFENKFLQQGINENRSIEQTLDLAWELLRMIPKEELTKVGKELREKYY